MSVTVGVITCSTGPSSYFGKVIANGIRLGLADFEDHKSMIHITVQQCDDAGDESKAVAAVSNLDQCGAAIIIGPCESHTACAIVETAAKVPIPVISPSATASVLTEQNNPWFFRATPSDAQKADRLVSLIALRHPHGAVIVFHEARLKEGPESENMLCGESVARDLRRYFSKSGQVSTYIGYNRDYSDDELRRYVISSLHKRTFVGVIILGRSSDTLRVAHIIRDVYGPCPIYLISPGKEMFEKANLGNLFAVTDTIIETIPDVDIEKFRSRYNNEFPGSEKKEAIDQYATFGFDTAHIVGDALIRVAKSGIPTDLATQRVAIRKALADTSNDRRGLMSDGGFTQKNELSTRPHFQYLEGRQWRQLSLDDAIKEETYEKPGRWAFAHREFRRARLRLDVIERSIVVRALNITGYLTAGIVAILALMHLLK